MNAVNRNENRFIVFQFKNLNNNSINITRFIWLSEWANHIYILLDMYTSLFYICLYFCRFKHTKNFQIQSIQMWCNHVFCINQPMLSKKNFLWKSCLVWFSYSGAIVITRNSYIPGIIKCALLFAKMNLELNICLILHSKIWQNVYFPEMWYQIQKITLRSIQFHFKTVIHLGLILTWEVQKNKYFFKATNF